MVVYLRVKYFSLENTVLTERDLQSQLGLYRGKGQLWRIDAEWGHDPLCCHKSMFTSTFNISCRQESLVLLCDVTDFPFSSSLSLSLCASPERWNLWLYFLLFKREASFCAPMQVLLMILVLWCYVKHDVKDTWQDCWGGKRWWCTALLRHRHHLLLLPLAYSQSSRAPPSSSLQIYSSCWMQAELFCILPITPQGQRYRS